jgi:hypothetical protein
MAADGTENSIGIAAGGNVLVGDFQRPASMQADGTYVLPDAGEIVSGSSTPDGAQVAEWSFVLAELSLFNRAEWAKTQPMLPGPGEAGLDPSLWTVSNLPANGGTYAGEEYLPRYYRFGPDDEVPIYNKGDLYWDPEKSTWVTSEANEVPFEWSEEMLTIADPSNPNDPVLYAEDGTPKAVLSQAAPAAGWISDEMYKLGVEYMESLRPQGKPLTIDGLLYTNNAIFGIVNRMTPMQGQLLVNGALVAADLGLLAPGWRSIATQGTDANLPNSPYKMGLQLNYDERVKDRLNVINPNQVRIERTLWNPTANLL